MNFSGNHWKPNHPKTDTPFIRLSIHHHPSCLLAHQSPSPETGDPQSPKRYQVFDPTWLLSSFEVRHACCVFTVCPCVNKYESWIYTCYIFFILYEHPVLWTAAKYGGVCVFLCFAILFVLFLPLCSKSFRKSGALFFWFYAHKHTVLRRYYEVPWCWFRASPGKITVE